ncbi:MAG: EscT/YscT/HrcT family type III secretion system export apparatus protein [Myxococcota bacterium]
MFDLLTDQGIQTGLWQGVTLGALVIARLALIVQLVPFLGGQKLPQQVKMGITLALAIVVFPAVWSQGAAARLPASALPVAALVTKELAIGVTLGFVAALTFESARMAGELIDVARGQTMIKAMVPQLQARASATGDILYQLSVVMFLAVGGHRLVLAALYRSFEVLPVHTFPSFPAGELQVGLYVARLTADAITFGVLLALPVIVAVLLANLVLALMNKAAPQMNVFFLGMPLKAMLGVAVLLFGLHIIVDRLIDDGLARINHLQRVVELLGGG